MKKSIKAIIILTAALGALALSAGCGASQKDEPINKYTAESGMYAVSLPGQWTEGDNMGMKDMLNLSKSDGAETVILGMVKGQILGQGGEKIETLEDFFDYADSTFLNGPTASTELKDAEAIELAALKASMAKEGTMTQKAGGTGKIFVECGETENAYYLFMFSPAKGYDKKIAAIRKSFSFEELEVPMPETLSDTLRWFNASYAVITSLNGGDLNVVAGFEPGSMIETTMKGMLQRDWDVSDRASLEESINWLITEGHNQEALKNLTDSDASGMSREELISAMEDSGFDSEEQTMMLSIYDAKAAYNEEAIAGWDLSRAMSLIGWGYLSGYYTYEEAMDKSLETANVIRGKFNSWDDFFNSYFYGYSYWSGNDIEDTSSQAYQRKQLYEELKAKDKGPLDVDWNADLQKEW